MKNYSRTPFGTRLLQTREHARLTQAELTKAVGMAQSTYGKLETSGKGSSYVPSIAECCGVSAMWLATGRGGMFDGVKEIGQTPVDPLLATRRVYVAEIEEMLAQIKDRAHLNIVYSRIIENIAKCRDELLPRDQGAQGQKP